MARFLVITSIASFLLCSAANALVLRRAQTTAPPVVSTPFSKSFGENRLQASALFSATAASALTPSDLRKKERKEWVRRDGGIFAFNTKFGALNPFAIYYGFVAVFFGIPWYFALTLCQFLYFITGNRWDPQRRVPVFLTHIWGTLLLRFTHSFPKVENYSILKEFYQKRKDSKGAMFVANHNSWMDIPFLGATIGFRNYKIISKKELSKVPILGKAIKVGGNILLDRSDRKSQIKTLKKGIDYLNDGLFLCTYPEGTRSRSGRLMPFKQGAFKMAFKAGAPIIPVSIVGSAKVQPWYWMFPFKPSHPIAKVVVHPPIECHGKSEEEVAELVRCAIISGLPDDQKPTGDTPAEAND